MTVYPRTLWAGIACSAPPALWLLAQDFASIPPDAPTGGAALRALRGLWIAQAVALSLAGPLQSPSPEFGGGLLNGVVLVLAGLPVYTLPWLCGGAQANALGAGLAALLGYAAALAAVRSLARWEHEQPPLVTAFGICLGAAVWALRDVWLSWLLA